MKNNYNAQGFKKEKRVNKVQTTQAKNLIHAFTCSALDELQINATITSQRELDQFVSFLISTRPCLEK